MKIPSSCKLLNFINLENVAKNKCMYSSMKYIDGKFNEKIQTKDRSGIGLYLSISVEIHAELADILVNKFTVYCKVANERLEQLKCSCLN